MTRDPVVCAFDDSIQRVGQLMRDHGVGCVVVLRDGKVAGLVTDRQLATAAVAEGRGADTRVEEVMTKDPACLTLDGTIFSAVDSLRSAGVVRRLPVVNSEKELVGIVSIGDIALIARDLVEAVLLDETHAATNEARVFTGAKRIAKEIRRPTKMDRLPPQPDVRPVTAAAEAPQAGPPPVEGSRASWGGGEP